MQVSGLSVDTSWSFTPISSGAWDAAYDIWFHQTSNYNGGQPNGAEMMIWLNYQGGVQPAGSQVDTVSLAGATWEVWRDDTTTPPIISYRITTKTTSASFDVNTFVMDAVARGYISNSWYLVSVEAGFELWQGGVGLMSNSFSVSQVANWPLSLWGFDWMNEAWPEDNYALVSSSPSQLIMSMPKNEPLRNKVYSTQTFDGRELIVLVNFEIVNPQADPNYAIFLYSEASEHQELDWEYSDNTPYAQECTFHYAGSNQVEYLPSPWNDIRTYSQWTTLEFDLEPNQVSIFMNNQLCGYFTVNNSPTGGFDASDFHIYFETSMGIQSYGARVGGVASQDSALIIDSVKVISGRLGGPDDFGYTFADSLANGGPSYDWKEISGTGTEILPDSDDAWVGNIGLGFFFNYYGVDYSQLAIGNNGLLFSGTGTSQYVNQPITQTPSIHGFIAPYWDDLVTWGSAGAIYYQTLGTAPNREFVVEWYDNQHYSSSTSGITFEAILYEGSDNILFQYKDVDFGTVYGSTSGDLPPYNNGGSATVGIEDPTGSIGLQYSFNEQVITPGLAILFKFPAFAGTNMHLSMNAPVSMDHGNTMTYTFYYNDLGDVAAPNVVLQATLSANLDFVTASDSGVYDPSTRTVTWNLGTVPAFPAGRGSTTISATIPTSVPVGTIIQATSSISTTTLETRYDDNTASSQTTVTGSNLPPNVGVGPTLGNTGGTPSVYWGTPVTFTYYDATATGVDIRIHFNDGGSDIMGSMTGGPPDWTYTVTFYPRHGQATVTYTVQGPTPQSVAFNIYVDPAGYVYDVNTLSRVAGATVWLQIPDGQGGWENASTGQNPPIMQPDTNPLITGTDGQFQWDVLEGTYRLHVEAPGYYPTDSIVVTVPPPVTDLHIGLTPLPATTHAITFTESGLPSAAIWSVTLSSITLDSSTDTITFAEINGAYSYAINTVAGYTAFPASGTITVNDGDVNQPITFTLTNSITFAESGLLAGSRWGINLINVGSISGMAGNTISFAVPYGTFSYVVDPVAGYSGSPSSGTITANGGNVNQPISFTVAQTETALVGVKNVVTLNNVSIVMNPASGYWTGGWTGTTAPMLYSPTDESFSIQQNFLVQVPSDSGPAYFYWVQNVIFVEGFYPQGWYAVGITNIYNLTGNQDPTDELFTHQTFAQNYVTLADNPTIGQPFSVPGTYTLTSYVSGGQVIMSNDFFNYTWAIPDGNGRLLQNSSIVSTAPIAFLTPELVIVGPPANTTAVAGDVFLPSTNGSVLSYIQLAGHSWTSAVDQSPVDYGLAASVERSMGLNWLTSDPNNVNFTNGWPSTNQTEGIFYMPMATSSTQNGDVFFDQTLQTGVSVSIRGSSDPDGTTVAIATAQLSGWQQSGRGIGQVTTGPAAYYDVYVQGVSDGTATISIANDGVLGQTTMEYWSGTLWLEATDAFVSGSTVTGNIPVSALNGTIVALGPILAITSFTASQSSPSEAGSTVTLSAAAGNPNGASLLYRFSIDDGQTWTTFDVSNTFVWITTRSDAGNYVLLAQVSDGHGQVVQSSTVSLQMVSLPGDINLDGKVSLADLVLLANAYDSKPGDSNWNPSADITGHGAVDLSDLLTLAQHYGQTMS